MKPFQKIYSLVFFLSVFAFHLAHAEGTKQTQPNSTLTNRMRVNGGNGTNTGNNFGFSSSELEKLYVHIKDFTNERIYFGFDLITSGDVYMRIKDPSGAIVYGPVLLPQTSGPGFIDSYSQAFNGPSILTAGGYNALSFDPESNGDYSIEFNRTSPTVANTNTIEFQFYDITVGDKTTLDPIDGRLYAYMWGFSTASFANGAEATFYAYTDDQVVTTLHLNGMQPFAYGVFCNRTGAYNTGDVTEDRKSTDVRPAPLPEFKLFLNNPDEEDYPSAIFPTLNEPPSVSGCATSGYCVEVDIDKVAEGEVFLDLNGNGVYDAGTVDVLLNTSLVEGTNCVPWDGLDGLGATVTPGTFITGFVKVIAGLTNFPVWDAEDNTEGVNVAIVRPTAEPPLVFWDDTDISGGTSNLTGSSSPAHTWDSSFGNNRLINTWWYTFTINESFTYTIDSNCPPIANPDYLDVCIDVAETINPLANDTDSEGNMNTNSLSIVTAPANGTAVVNSGGTITYTPNASFTGTDEIVYQVCDNTALCSNTIGTSGKITINVGPYFELSNTDVCGSATDGTISFTTASTTLTYDYTAGTTYSGPATPSTSTVNGINTISGLGAGDYTVRLHNGTCFTDETITILDNAGPSLTLSYVPFCDGGTTSITFPTSSTDFRYDYSSGASYSGTDPPAAYISVDGTNSINGISAGTYTVRVYESATGCFSDATIAVASSGTGNPSFGTTSVENSCGDSQGTFTFQANTGFLYDYTEGIFYTGPSSPNAFTAVAGDDEITGLDAGTYTVRLKNNGTSCFTDQTFTISSDDPVLSLSKEDICDGVGTGSISFPTSTTNYRYGISTGTTYTGTVPPTTATVNGTNTINSLSANTYTVRLYDPGNTCFSDQTITIETPDSPTFTLEKSDGCGAGTGTIFFTTTETGLKYDFSTGGTYSGTNPPTDRTSIDGVNYITNLNANTYTVRLYNPSTGCSSDETITVSSSTNPSLSLTSTGSTCADGTIVFPASAGLKYDYNLGGSYFGDVPPTANTTTTSNTIGGLASGIYTVRLHDSSTGCFTDETITVSKTANCGPVAGDNSITVGVGSTAIITAITSDDTDQDGTIDLATIDLDPSTGGIQTSFTGTNGNWSVDSGGNVTFTPNGNFVGTTSITYTVNDNDGDTSNAANLSVTATAPAEICDNGIDDDFDGLIDCFDPDCSGVGGCSDFFYGQNTPVCFNPPAVLPEFELEEIFRTDAANYGFDQRSGVMVGDIDNDGISELVTHDRTKDVILIFNGIDGSIKQTIQQNQGSHQFAMVALGDVDSDGLGDVFATEGGNTTAIIRRYEYSAGGNQTGTSNAIFSTNLVGTRVNYSSPQLADFNEDGSPEVYIGANIINAETGVAIAQDNTINSGRLNSVGNNGDRLPIAYNIFNEGDVDPVNGGTFGSEANGLEFIAGNQVYLVDFSTNSFILAAEITGANLGDGFVSLGDLNNDNKVDIVVTSEGYIFAWDPRTETQIGTTYNIPNTTSGGKANVGDFDNDGIVDIGFAGSNRYIVLEFNSGANTFSVKWSKTGLDDGSQRTGSTLYDFEGDGIAEVVYSEEENLYIFSGLDGSELTRIQSQAGTRVEYPLVADVNNDGQAEIIVTSQSGNGAGSSGVDDWVAVYKSANSSWVSSREVWNQHGYHVTNVNDDLTIPQYQQDIFHPQFGGSLNGFLVQTTYLDAGGEPTYATSDLVVTASSVDQNCASTNNGLDISMTIHNTGDWKAPRTTPITIYDADPYAGTANVMDTVHLPVTLEVGQSRVVNTTVADNGQDFTLFVLVNHNPYETGTTTEISTPLAAGTTNTWVNECDYTNNSFSEAIINCNDEPIITDVDVSVNEDNTYTFAATDFSSQFTDADGETIDRIQITSLPTAAEGVLYLDGVAITLNQEIDFADLADITFVPTDDFFGTVTFGWNAHDGTEYALTGADVNIDVQPINDSPLLTLDADNSGGGTDDDGFDLTYTESDGVVSVLDTGDAAISDVDDTEMSSLSITLGGLQDGDDEEVIINGVTFSLGSDDTQTSSIGGTTFQIAYVSGVFTLTNNAGGDMSVTDLNSILATIQYQHTNGNNPTDGDRTLTLVVNDGDDNSTSVVSTISVTSVNDAPVAIDDPSNELVENGSLSINTIGNNDTDVDGTVEPSTITLIDPSNPSNTGNSASDLVISGVGTYSVDISGNVTFTPESGYIGDASINYTIEDNNGATSNAAEIEVTVIAKPKITLGTNPTVCEGASSANLTYSATAGSPDQYSIDYTNASFTDISNAALPASPISLVIPGGISEGIYTATLTVRNSSNGYVSDVKNISITITDTPSIAATATNPTTCGGSEGSISLSGVKNSTTYSVSYTFNSSVVTTNITSGGSGNSLTISGLVEGTYTNISVTSSGCSSNIVASVSLSDPTPATIALGTTSDPSSCNGANGSIQITGLAANTNYSFNYDKNASAVSTSIMSNASGNYTLSGLTSGTYEDFVVTNAGCTSNTLEGPVTLSDPSAPTITFDSDEDPASCSSTDGFIILSSLITGREYEYSYTKNSTVTTGTLTADGSGKITINNLPAGTYTSIYVDDVLTGCQSNVIPSLVLNPPDIVLGTTNDATTCSGTEGSIEINSLAASTDYDLDYSLNGTPVATASITTTASGEYTISGLTAGSYTNIRFENGGCVTNSLSATLSEPTAATIAQGTATNPSTCSGSNGSIQVTGLDASTSYTVDYTDDGTPVSITKTSDGTGIITITALNAGAYTNISVTKDNCTSNSIASVILSDPVAPTATLGDNPEVCSGVTSTQISYTSTTGSPDRYSINFDATANTAGFADISNSAFTANSLSIDVGSTDAGVYNAVLSVTNSTTSCSTDYNITITVNANPTITLGSSPAVCQGEISADLTYSATTGSPNEYAIDFNAAAEAQGFVDVANISLGASPIVVSVPAGANSAIYNATLKVTNTTTGCVSTNTAFTIQVNDKPDVSLGSNPEVCEGSTSADLSYSGISGDADQYTVSFDATAQAQGFADVATSVLPASPISITVPGAAATGTYNGIVNVINSTSGCISDSKAFTIKINSTPDITFGSSPSICFGETSTSISYTGLSGGANQYSIDFDATAEGQGFADISNASLSPSPLSISVPAGAVMDVYNALITVKNSATGCVSDVKSVTVTVNDNPSFTLGASPEVCRGTTSGDLAYTISAGSPDQYSINFDATGEGQGFADVTNAALGASPISIAIPSSAAVNTYNATIILTNSATGCVSSETSFTVKVNAVPTISLGVNPAYCEGETTGGISYSATTGSPDLYSIDFADASFSDIVNQPITATPLAFSIPGATGSGTYAATITVSNSSNSCESVTSNFNVIIKNTPAITSTSSNPTTCSGVDGSITISGLNDAITYAVSYNKDGAPVSTSVTPSTGDIVLSGLSEGAYTNIKVTEDGCDSNEISLITLSDPATATISLQSDNDPTTCGGSDGNIVINTGIASIETYTVEYLFNSVAVSVSIASDASGDVTIGSLSAGQYEDIKVTANGCESNELSGPINLIDPTTPTITYSNDEQNPTSCSSSDGFIKLGGLVNGSDYDFQYTKDGITINKLHGTYPGALTADGAGQITIINLEAGSYTDISVEPNGTGCISNTIPSIVLNPPDIVLGSTENPITCSGTEGSIEIGGLAANLGYELNYNLNGNPVATVAITSDASGEYTINNLSAGTYTNVRVTNNGCVSNSLSTTLADPTKPVISEGTHTNPSTCGASSGTIQISGLAGSTTYSVSYTNSGSTTVSNMASNGSGIIEISGLSAGTYTDVTATLSNCESNALAITLSDPVSPTFTLADTDQEVCEGALASTTSYTITGGSADTYSITFGATATNEGFVAITDAALSGGNITIDIPAGAEARSYNAFVSVKNTTTSCESAVLPVSILINYEPTVTLEPIPEICLGVTQAFITYADTLEGTDNYNLNWGTDAINDGFVNVVNGILENENPITLSVPVTATAKTYTGVFTVENSSSGCISQNYSISLKINENPSLTLGTNPEVCFGDTSSSIAYTNATGSPDQYIIDFDATAEGQGFVDVATSSLTGSSIDIIVPAGANPSTYNADLIITNSSTNCNSSSLPFTVTVNAYPTEPTVNTQTTGDDTPVISGNADNGSSITVIVGGATYSTTATGTGWTIDTGSDTPSSGSFAPNTNGVNEVQVRSEFNGCSISDTSSDELTIDTTAPIVPTVTGQVTNSTVPTITGTAEPGSEVTVEVGGATYIVTADASGNWSVDTNVAPDLGVFNPNLNGANEVQVTSEDGAGNTTVDVTSLELVIDTTAPAVPTVVSQTTNDTTPVITGTAEAGSTVTVVVGGATYTVTADVSGNWSIDTELVTPDSGTFAPDVNGTNEVVVTSTDEAGNSTSDVTTLELVIDTTAPAVPTVVSQTTNDTTPVITGTAEAGSTVTVVVGGATYTVTADGSGNWSIDTGVLAPTNGTFNPNVNGSNEVSVTSTDSAGNISNDITNLELVIDTTAPAVPTVVSQTTNDTTPVITGTAEAGSTVTVVVGGATYTVTADGSGNWSIDTELVTPDSGTFAPDVNGTNEVTVTSTDEAGNSTSDVTTLELVIDTSDPIAPTVDPLTTNDTTPVITGTGEVGSIITIVINGTTFETIVIADGTWVIDTETATPTAGGPFIALAEGDYNVVATSTDSAGNSSSEANVDELTIDTTAPAVPTVVSQTTNDTTPVITGTAEAGSTVTVVVGGATYTVTADGSGNWSIDTELVTPDSGTFAPDVNGSNEVSVTSTDSAGNISNDITNLELVIDTTAPAVPTVVSQTTNDTTPVITGTAEAGSTVTVVVGGATYTVTADGSGNWSIDTELVTPDSGTFAPDVNGTNEVTVTSTDEAGNSTSDVTTLELVIDTSDPIAPTVDPLTTNDTTPVITGTGEVGSIITIVINGTTFETIVIADGTWVIDTETATPTAGGPFIALAEGDYNVVATSTDSAGNSSSEANVDELTIDTTAPAVPTVVSQTTNDTTPVITGTAEAGSTVTVVVGGATYTVTADGSGNWSIDTEVVTPDSGTFAPDVNGTNEVAVTSTDEAGNSTSDVTTLELVIDTTAPAVPTVVSQTTNDTTPVITGTAEAGSTVTVVVGGATYTVTADGSGNWSIDTELVTPDSGTFAPDVNGTNEVAVTSTDEAGNSTSDVTTLELVIDTTAPAVPTVVSQTTNDTTPVITGTAEAGSTVTVVVGGATYTVTADVSGNWSIDTELVTPDSGTFAPDVNGTNEVAVTSTDEAGNSTSDVTTLELVIDTTAPAVPTVVSQTTNDTTPVITGTAEAGSTVTVVVGGATYTVTADGSGNWSIDTELVTPDSGTFAPDVNGTNEVAVTSTDEAGNSTSDVTTLELVIDTTAPAVPTVVSQTTNDTTPVITGTAEAGSTVTVVVGGATYTVTADVSGNWSIDTELVTPDSGTFAPDVNGTNEVAVTSTDEAGNSTSDVTTLELVIDTTAPAVPTVVSQTTNDTTPVITGTAEAGSTVTVVVGGATYTVTADGSGNWSIDTGVLAPTNGTFNPNVNGSNEVSVTSTDSAGNISNDITNLELVIDTTAPAVPTVVSQTTNDTTPVITGTAEAGSTVTVVVGGATYTVTADGSGNWSIDTELVTPDSGTFAPDVNGTNEVAVTSTDEAGNSTSDVTTLELVIDTTAPAVPTVVSQTTNDTTPVITGTAEAGSTVTVVVGGATYTVTADVSGNWSIDTEVVTPDSGTFAPDVNGTNEVAVTSTDEAGNSTSDVTTLELTIDQNDAPVATVENIDTNEDIDISGSLVNNVNDPENQNLTFTLITSIDSATEGTFTLNSDGTYTFEPVDNFNGNLTLTYQVCDDGDPILCDQESINITVNAVNDIPSATGETLTVDEDNVGSGDLSDNVTDIEGDNLTFSLVNGPDPSTEGTVTINPDGTYTFIPFDDFNGTVTFTYEVCDDGTPAQCSQATVTIVVNAVNDAPSAQNDVAGVNPGSSVIIPVLDNDSDLEGNTLTVSQITIQPSNGTVTIHANGTITYTPNAGFDNGMDTFTYEVCDNGSPSECTTATVTVSVPEQEFSPTAVDDVVSVSEDEVATGNVLDNDSDGNGDNLTVNTMPVAGPNNGTLVLNADGTYTYTPDPDFNGTDSFTYEVCDDSTPPLCSQATVTITVSPANDAPTATGETLTVDEDTSGNGTLADNVTDLEGDNLTFKLKSGPNPTTEGTVTVNPDGTYTFVPADGFNGTTSFVYEVCDDGSPIQCAQATVTIEVNPVNDSPIANDDFASTDPGVDVIITVLANDTDPEGNDLTVSQITIQPSNGTVTINADGTVTYTPNAGFNNGTDTFTYEVCDNGNPSLCTTATVTVSVPEQELSPEALDDAVSINEDEVATGNVLDNDSDGNNDPLTVNTTPVSGPSNGTLVLNTDGTYTYTPDPGFSGTDSFVYEVCDDSTPAQCDMATVTITVNAVNDAPVATPETIITDEDTSTSGTLGDNVTDEDSGSLSFSLVTSLDAATEGVFTLNSDGSYTFVPAENFTGTLTLTYEVCDDSNPALCAQETITITVNPINDAPIASDDQIVQDGFAQIDNTLTGLVSDAEGDPLTFSLVTPPSNGTLSLNPDGSYTFIPESGFFGTVTFVYEVCDNDTPPLCAQATVTIEITANGDTDGDGITDGDEDTDGDGDPTNDDCDGDSTPNYLDTDPCDTDGDGILDDDEDTDGDGNPYNDDCDEDGIPNFQDTDPCDTDGDGILDDDEDNDGDGNPYNDDCDGDNIPNFLDPDVCDQDGDGILDDDEDTDGDGNLENDDCDGDSIPNYLDPDPCDTDGDGVLDDDEDTDGDGNPYNDDCDEDGIPNFQDLDSCDTDGDGLDDEEEDTNNDGDPYNDDCDDDGVPNFLDTDECVGVNPMPGFTPDGNGENDFFYIEGIEDYPNNVVQIFNRWGNKLFEVDGYDNQNKVWRGEADFGVVLGDRNVPEGTYFYLIDLGDGSKPLSGFIVIKR